MFPTAVDINEKNIEKLKIAYANAYKQILSEIDNATDFGVANRKRILAQIQENLQKLGGDINEVIDSSITDAYKLGANQATDQLDRIGADVSVDTGFNKIHNEAIAALVDDTQTAFGESIQGVNRSVKTILNQGVRDQITQQMATGKIGGAALREIKNSVVGAIQNQGLTGLVDKRGASWALDRYAEMLIRTKTVESRNRGLANRMVENDYDLVQVSSHGATDVCADWEGKILSVTGDTPGYDTVADAEADGLFHPNCKHAINVLTPELAIKTSAYDSASGDYLDSAEDDLATALESALKYDSTFKNKVSDIASALDAQVKHGTVKTDDRAMQKILADYGLNVAKVQDLNRSTLLVSDPGQMDDIVKTVKKQFNVTRVKNDFENPDVLYKKAIINVEIPGGISEIQITTEEYWTARKDLGAHALYKQVRVKADGWEEMEKQMNKLYDDAAKALDARLNSS